MPLTAKDKERVIALIEICCAPYQILDTVREENEEPYKYSDVWKAWKSHWDQQYKSDSNPVISATSFVKKSKKFDLILEKTDPHAFGFLVMSAVEMVTKYTIKELFVDSTYKTNGKAMEVFTVLGKILGTGFPIAYLFLAGAKELTDRRRKDSLLHFFRKLRESEKLNALQPTFFFSDKDTAQLKAIEKAFAVKPSLCLWHMKRAIKQKIGSLRKEKR